MTLRGLPATPRFATMNGNREEMRAAIGFPELLRELHGWLGVRTVVTVAATRQLRVVAVLAGRLTRVAQVGADRSGTFLVLDEDVDRGVMLYEHNFESAAITGTGSRMLHVRSGEVDLLFERADVEP